MIVSSISYFSSLVHYKYKGHSIGIVLKKKYYILYFGKKKIISDLHTYMCVCMYIHII